MFFRYRMSDVKIESRFRANFFFDKFCDFPCKTARPMIKWLKKLVKGSDFVVTKKKISVIALDPRAGKSYGEDIAQLFSDVADISVFSMLDSSAAGVLERADLFVASTDASGSPE